MNCQNDAFCTVKENKNGNKIIILAFVLLLIVAVVFAVLITDRASAAEIAPAISAVSTTAPADGEFSYLSSQVSGQCGPSAYWILDTQGLLKICGQGDFIAVSTDYYAPDTNYTDWLGYRNNIKSVIIESGITNIASNAFIGCKYIESVDIPDSVKSIGYNSFYGCYLLNQIILPNSVESVHYNAFSDCPAVVYCHAGTTASKNIASFVSPSNESFSICEYQDDNGGSYILINGYIGESESVVIPSEIDGVAVKGFYDNGYNSYRTNGFYQNTQIEEIQISEGITEIPYNCFAGCSSLKSVHLPGSLMSIDNYAFYRCTLLEAVTFGDGLETIGNYAFYGCSYLKIAIFGDSLETIGNYAFYGCSSLESAIFGDSLETIGEYALYGCSSLENATFGDSLETIGEYALRGCSSLKAVTFGDSLKSIGKSAFESCSSLESVIIGKNLKSIGCFAFGNCPLLFEITIPAKAVELSWNIFDGQVKINCYKNSTAHVYAEESNLAYYLIDGTEEENSLSGSVGMKLNWHIDFATGTLTIDNTGSMVSFSADDAPWKEYKQFIRHIVIKDGCTTVSNNAFSGCTYVSDAALPEGITKIGDNAFYGLSLLTEINLPESLETIGNSAFRYCGLLENVYFGDSLLSIGNHAFYDCYSLKDISFGKSLNHIGESTFYECTLLNLDIDSENMTIDGNAFYRAGVKSLKLKSGYIKSYAFESCCVKNVWIGKSVSLFYNRSFYNCNYLETAYIDSTSITGQMFYGCNNLESVTIGENVKNIDTSAFYGCSSLKEVVLPYNVSSIGSSAFANCKLLNTVTIYNRDCSISETSISIYSTIYGFTGSSAERFAEEYGYGFVPLDGVHEHVYDNPCDDRCNLCNEARITAHQYGDWHLGEESTCIIYGYNERVCSVCGNVETERLPLVNHSYGDWVTEREPTCSLVGVRAAYCSVCNDCVTDEIPTVSHTFDNDCDEVCNNCGAVRPVPHFDEDQDGYCDICGAAVNFIKPGQTKTVNVSGNSISYLTFIPEDTGIYTFYSLNASNNTSGYVCNADKNVMDSNYGYYNFSVTATFTEGEIYYLGVKYRNSSYSGEINVSLICNQLACKHYSTVEYDEIPATCGEIGYTAGVYCNDCEMWISGHEIIPVAAHTFDNACDPTCNSCGYLRVTEHQFGEYKVTTAPNCGNDGEYTATCIICKATRKKAIPATGSHTYGDWAVKTASTCETPGVEARECVNCGNEQTRELPLAEHTYEKVIGTDATCDKEGKALFKCTVCDDLSVNTVPATGHSYVTESVAPGCTEKGYILHTCEYCGDSFKTDETEAAGHAYALTDTRGATCSENGADTFTCSVCGESYTETIPSTGNHIYGNWVLKKKSTCDSAGVESRVCQECGREQTRELPLTEHDYEMIIGSEVTCTKDGKGLYICKNCRDLSVATIPATGHIYIINAVPANCTESGYTLHKCENCGAEYKTDEIDATGHRFISPQLYDATCTENGSLTYTCSECGYSYCTPVLAKGHSDADSDGYCDSCGIQLTQSRPTIWQRIIAFFRRLFGIIGF